MQGYAASRAVGCPVGAHRPPPLPPDTTPSYLHGPRLGGQLPLGPSAWFRAVQYGTPAQQRRAWLILGGAVAVLLGVVALVLLSIG